MVYIKACKTMVLLPIALFWLFQSGSTYSPSPTPDFLEDQFYHPCNRCGSPTLLGLQSSKVYLKSGKPGLSVSVFDGS